ncbi:MAG TPA: YdeI family protein, partial [Xenococcaceae cyanobacterium]
MGKFEASLATFEAINRQSWRNWLQQNHQNYSGVWLIYYKVKSGKPSIRYQEAVQEALCFGWIDSKVKSLDEARYQQIFTPRKPNSVWSKLNKQYVQELIAQNLMTEAGLEKIAIAKQNGSWHTLDEVEALIIPEDLQKSLKAN